MVVSTAPQSSSPASAGGPFFLVGQDPGGHWLAVETHGLGGGLFASRDAALGYVRRESAQGAAAFRMAEAPIDLAFASVHHPARRRA